MPRALLAILAALAACGGPRFHRAGPRAPAPIAIDRVTLQWSNVYLITRGADAVLVDSGSPGDRAALAAALAARGVPPESIKAVVITHAHADHAGCARWLQTRGAKLVLGADDAATAARGRNEPLVPTGLMPALLATVFMFPFEPFAPDVAVDRELDLGAFGFPELRVMPVPGHTAGSIAAVLGDEAFVGDMIKGGEVLARSPTEHLYQTDRLADHAALRGLLDRKLARLYLGHSGPLVADDVARWLPGAEREPYRASVSLELDARGELPRDGDPGATAGFAVRYALGRPIGYAAAVELRAGYVDGALYEADARPLGVALRCGCGAQLAATAGVGIGGIRGNSATRFVGELAADKPAGPLHLIARATVGWRLGGPRYADDAHGVADELTAQLGLRFGRDRRWGAYLAGKGPYVALTYRDLGGAELFGVALGLDAFAAR